MDGMVREPDRRISILVGGGVGGVVEVGGGGGWGGHIWTPGCGLHGAGLSLCHPSPSSYIPDLLCFASQGGGQPLGHGPHQHLQEGTEAGRAAGRVVPGGAGSGGRAGTGSPAWGARVPVPVPFPPLELLQPQQGLWAHPAAGSV